MPGELAELLAARSGETLDLHAEYANPQMIRVLRTIGFDKDWARTEGAYLFDDEGNRLGYGGGFYDVFLRAAGPVPRVGICFDVQIVEAIPLEDHDEGVDVVVTEERVIRRRRLP